MGERDSIAGNQASEALPRRRSILELRGVHKAFGGKEVLCGVDLRIESGLITVIIGGSGAGKSVLVKHLIGLIAPDSGQVLFHGRDLGAMSRQELIQARTRFGMLFQSGALFDSMSVYENVAFPLREHRRLGREEERRLVSESLEALNLFGVERLFPSELSGGMRKRVALARATILQPEIIIYDEPTTGLDPVMIKQVDDMIAETRQRLQVTSVVISHDMASTFRIAHRVAMLHQGRIIAFSTPGELRQSSNPVVSNFIHVSGTGPLSSFPSAVEASP
jgi:phospholipid/cholesterol/gamma-HCH transport system ATP-binding protein